MAVVTAAAFAAVFGHAFLSWDDFDYVRDNALVTGRHYGPLLRAVVLNNFHPLTMLSLAWNAGTPLSPQPFLVTNVALHVLDTLLVFWLVLELSGGRIPVAALVALGFGLHPMHVESVAWISERKDVLYVFFFLAAAIAYGRHLKRPSAAALSLTFALFVLSCLAKGMAVVFPAVMVLLDLWKRRPLLQPRGLLEKLPFLAVALLFGLIALDAQAARTFHGWLQVAPGAKSALELAPPLTALQRAVLPAYAYLMYAARLVVPVGLCAFHPYPAHGQLNLIQLVVAPLFLIATLAVAVWDTRRGRLLTFGIGWFFVTVALVLQWVPVGQVMMSERYTYLPYVGLLFPVAVGFQKLLDRAPGRAPILWGLAGLVLVVWFVETTRQVETWKDSETLWTRVIEVYPHSGTAYARLGTARLEAGRAEDALSSFQSAQAMGAPAAEVNIGLGAAYGVIGAGKLGESDARGALAALDRAIAFDPGERRNLAAVRASARLITGDLPGALADLDFTVASGRATADTYYQRAMCRIRLGDHAGADSDLAAVARLDPTRASAMASQRALNLAPNVARTVRAPATGRRAP